MELIFTAGIALLAISGILVYSLRQSSAAVSMNEANDAVNSLVLAADTVYALGPGSERHVTVTLPGGMQNSYVTSRSVGLNISVYGGYSEIRKRSRAILTGEIPGSRGTYTISVRALESGAVELSSE